MSATSFSSSQSGQGGNTLAQDLGPQSGFETVPTRIGTPSNISIERQEIPEVLEKLEQLEAQIAQFHRIASEAYCSQGRYGNALMHQEIVVRLQAQSLEDRNQLGYLRYLNGDDGAIEDFEEVVRADPQNAEAWFNMAMIRFGQSQFGEAERGFAEAAQLQPGDAETWNNLGVARFQNGRVMEARACFERALQIDSNNEDAKLNLLECGAS